MTTDRKKKPNPKRKTVPVDLHGITKIFNLIDAAGHKSTLEQHLPPKKIETQAKMSAESYKKIVDIINSTPILRNNAEIQASIGCNPLTEPDCIGF